MSCQIEVQRVSITRKATNAERMMSGTRSVTIGFRFRVVLYINEGMFSDGMWAVLKHAALFASETEAEKLADKVRKAVQKEWMNPNRAINPENWMWDASTTNVYAFMQKQPTAKEYNVG